jgi:hypothetical protein
MILPIFLLSSSRQQRLGAKCRTSLFGVNMVIVASFAQRLPSQDNHYVDTALLLGGSSGEYFEESAFAFSFRSAMTIRH